MESVKDGHRQQLLSVSNRGSFRKEAVTSLCNRLQMRRHYKAMLMRPARALWDRHPRSVNVNLSPNVHLRAWRGMEEAERKKNNQHLPPSCFQETFTEQQGLFNLNVALSFSTFLHLIHLISRQPLICTLYIPNPLDELTVTRLIMCM